ncbi:hypothetical protein [Tsukamurella sp. NPDC003166]|uniref:hypothetical protein n=1 Tax=Tsukamurella sp. NPDC003166 TaxID=3154444 RepID=UPI0033A3E21C
MIDPAVRQYHDLLTTNDVAHDAFLIRVAELVDAPWDSWPTRSEGQLEYRDAQFGSDGLLSFLLDDAAEMLVIFNIVWAG